MISNFICEKPTAQCLMQFVINVKFIFSLISYYSNLNHLNFVESNGRNLNQNRITSKKLSKKAQSQFYYHILKKCKVCHS